MNQVLRSKNWMVRVAFSTLLTMLIAFGLIVNEYKNAFAQNRETILRVHGSNTVGAKLAPDLAKAFLKKMGATSVNKVDIVPSTEMNIEGVFPDRNLIQVIEIRAHGSTTGFKALKSGQADIGMASRKIKDKEISALSFLGNMTTIACEHVLALDGVAVIVNIANSSISKMDVNTLRSIFCGRITDWRQLGGAPGRIQLHARDDASGTHDTFKSLVLGKKCSLDPSAIRYDSNAALSKAVNRDVNAIGYCGLPYVAPNKVVGISDGGPAIRPNVFTIATEDYPLTRRLHFYTPANPQNPYTRSFIAFALGIEGQKYVKNNKFVELTISSEDYTVEVSGTPQNYEVLNKYLNAVRGAKRLSANIRFKTARYDLDTRAYFDLEYRIVDFLLENKADRIILAGFADSRGDYRMNHKLSCNRAKTVKNELRSRGIRVHEVVCVSEEVPVASNETELGQAKNRRVEIWIK